MRFQVSVFSKIIALIFLILIPVVVLFTFFYYESVGVVKREIQSSEINRQSFFMNQLESSLDQLSKFAIIASRDPTVKDYLRHSDEYSKVDKLAKQQEIFQKLSLQIVSSDWTSQLSLISLRNREVISTDFSITYDEVAHLPQLESQKWHYQQRYIVGANESYFFRYGYNDAANPEYLVEVRFHYDNLIRFMDNYKAGGKGDPFLYRPGEDTILNSSSDVMLVELLLDAIDPELPAASGIVSIDGDKYLYHSMKSESLGWYLVDYMPLEEALVPITYGRNLMYLSIGLLLVLSTIAVLLLYRTVQIPVSRLVRGVSELKKGNFSIRLQSTSQNEFDYLIRRFNEMAQEIQSLIETVYANKILLRETTLKQLQSQINPHFLYNCLFYIKNMASLGETEAVKAMAVNLGEYFRYTTRVEVPLVTLEEEIDIVSKYLSIQNLRNDRFHYEIQIPDGMKNLMIPKLLIQPVVENAIIHGVERSDRFGMIRILGEMKENECRVSVEDNGPGMTDEERRDLCRKINQPLTEEIGCGLWNVHQRLIHQFKEGSGLEMDVAPSGGLKVCIKWYV